MNIKSTCIPEHKPRCTRYWPIDGRSQVWRTVKGCVRCCCANPPPLDYVMGNLPEAQATQIHPFANVGVDYCGLFYIKDRKDRNRHKVKIYVAIFVCLSVKAVHIELVDDLTSEAFTPHFEDSSRGEGFTRPSIPTTARTSLGPTTNCGNFAFSYSRALTRRRYRHFYPIGKLNGASYPLTSHTSAGYERPR
jgi:hypothetical protein